MSDFNVRSDSVDVEQIMDQIRRRVRDKRGVDYTEEQIRELAAVRLEKFLDPKNLRSDLLEQFRKSRPPEDTTLPPVTSPYEFEDNTLYDTHRGLLRSIRRLLNPILKLFFNPNTIVHALHQQADLNKHFARTMAQARIDRAAWNSLYYEVLHNLVLETTRAGIELKNLKMRVEALSSRLDFSERRVRALEGVVQYRPEAVARERRPDGPGQPQAPGGNSVEPAGVPGADAGSGEGRRRRRRRRGRRGLGAGMGQPGAGFAGSGDAASDTAMDADGPDGDDGGADGSDFAEGETDQGPGTPDSDPQAS
jgi:hypothetical protein